MSEQVDGIRMRLDKYLCELNLGTRSQVKKDIKAGLVSVNGVTVLCPEKHVQAKEDSISYKGQPCIYEGHVYYLLHKPAGVVSATKDRHDRTVLDLIVDKTRKDLFPVGRLDKDTEGLLLITNDGALAHDLLAPNRHVEKEYECHLARPFDGNQRRLLEQGVDIGEKNPLEPAVVQILEDKKITLTIPNSWLALRIGIPLTAIPLVRFFFRCISMRYGTPSFLTWSLIWDSS